MCMHPIITVIDHVSEQDNQIEDSNRMDNVDDEISGVYMHLTYICDPFKMLHKNTFTSLNFRKLITS